MPNVLRLVALIVLLAAPVAVLAESPAQPRIDFVYFGAADCPYCQAWEAKDLPKLKAAPGFQKVRFTKVTKMIPSPVPSATWFPDEIKHLRNPIAAQIKGAGSPMFAIAADGKVVAAWKGTRKNPGDILKIIEDQNGQ